MRNVTISKAIKVDLTADQWQLYTHSEDLQAACYLAANFFNKRVEYFFNNQYSKDQARVHMTEMMGLYSDVGAMDTEPLGVLEDLLDLFYGE